MRVALYARYSSDLQNKRSIEDQFALARDYAARQGWRVVASFPDAAISGASTLNRPGLQDLMRGAETGEFDIVLTESLDRLARNQAAIATIYQDLEFLGVRIVTLADGEVSEMHIGLKGTMAALHLRDLAQKVRRGHIGRVREGRVPAGRLPYGYIWQDGRPMINEGQAAIVRRIVEHYLAGIGTDAIAVALNNLGWRGALGLHVLMGGLILTALTHPWFYVLLAYQAVSGQLFAPTETWASTAFWTVACVNLGAGYLISILVGALSVRRRGRPHLVRSALFMPLTWLLISAAAYRALFQLVTRPYLWEKTEHSPLRQSA